MVKTKIEQPKSWTRTLGALAWSHSFWSTLLYEQLKVVFTEDIPTLGVGGATLYCNPGYFEEPKFNDNNRIFMVAHEICHEMFFHPGMMQAYAQSGIDGEPFDAYRFNTAADYVINAMLIAQRVGQYHEDWLYSKHFTIEDNVLDVYRRLKPKNPPPPQGGQGASQDQSGDGGNGSSSGVTQAGDQQGQGSGQGKAGSQPQQYDILDKDGNKVDETPKGRGTQDSHLFDEPSPHEEADWKQAVAGAHHQAKQIGHGSEALDRMVEDYIEHKRDWREELRDYVTVSRGRETYDWRRAHKRKMSERRVFVPTKLSYKMGPVVFVHDVSGSVSHKEHMATKGAGVGILTDCMPKSLRVLCCASHVTDDQQMDAVEEYLDWQPKGTGGTDMEAAFQYLIDDNDIPELCIVLTDGWTPFTEPPPFPVVWLSTDKEVEHYPYGHAIKLELE